MLSPCVFSSVILFCFLIYVTHFLFVGGKSLDLESVSKYDNLQEATMLALSVRMIGNSLCLVLPEEAVSRLQVKEGDVVYLTETPDGGFRITPSTHRVAEQMAVAEDIMREDREVLRELAKK